MSGIRTNVKSEDFDDLFKSGVKCLLIILNRRIYHVTFANCTATQELSNNNLKIFFLRFKFKVLESGTKVRRKKCSILFNASSSALSIGLRSPKWKWISEKKITE